MKFARGHGCAAAGVLILGATSVVTISETTGFADPHAVLIGAIAAGVAFAAFAIGDAWRDKRRVVAIFTGLAVLSGELFGGLQTLERLTASREAKQAPIREIQAKLRASKIRIASLEARVREYPENSPRLVAAIQAKQAVDRVIAERAGQRDCVANCRALLEAQLSSADDELALARQEHETGRKLLESQINAEQRNLAVAGTPISASPLADRLGMDPDRFDVMMALLGALGANGLGACLIALGAHRKMEAPEAAVALPAQPFGVPVVTRRALSRSRRKPLRQHIGRFGAECLRSDPHGSALPQAIYQQYRSWCAQQKLAPVAHDEFTSAFVPLLRQAGVQIDMSSTVPVVRGVVLIAD